MKKVLLIVGLLLILTLFCTIMLSAQVSSWRNNSQQRTTAPRIQPSSPQRHDVSRWRTQTEPIRPGQPIPNRP